MTTDQMQSIAPRLEKDARREKMSIPPQPATTREPAMCLSDFDETLIPFSAEQAVTEASRCLYCPGAPCMKACVLGNDIPGAMWLISQGDFSGAAELYRKTSTMPEFCGRVCPQESLCEGACVLGKKGEPVALGRLEVFVADYDRAHRAPPDRRTAAPSGKHVGVVGSGPAGLSAAKRLRESGHSVTVYEALPKPGGLLVYGIPNFKLPKALVSARIDELRDIGVQFYCNTRIGEDVPFDEILAQHDALFVGTGASVDATARIEGTDVQGVLQATDFLIHSNLPPDYWPGNGGPLRVGRRVTIFGGGDTAMDCMRSALRLQRRYGHDLDVTCVYRRTEAQMPGNTKDRGYARDEGGKFEFLTAPLAFMAGEDGALQAVKCIRMELGEPDESGRRRPIEIPGSEFTIETDQAILALGYWPDPLIGNSVAGLETHDWGLITADPATGQTSLRGVFAGGDNVTGPDLVGTAAAAGIRAARAIEAYLTIY